MTKEELAEKYCNEWDQKIGWYKSDERYNEVLSDLNALLDKLMPTEEKETEWKDKTDFGYGSQYIYMRAGAKMGIEWFRSRMKGENK